MDEKAKSGFEAWVGWAGVTDESIQVLTKKLTPNLLRRFAFISECLFSPPSENVGAGAQFLEARADREFRRISTDLDIQPKAFWPESKPYAICFTHDIDRVVATYHRLRWQRPSLRTFWQVGLDMISALTPQRRERNPFYNFQRMQTLEQKWGIRSACYVLFEKRRFFFALERREPQHYLGVYRPESIFSELKEYERQGNEIGLHASFDSWKDTKSLQSELERLSWGGFHSVKGVRNHYLNFDWSLTPEIQAAAKLSYDSSIGFNFASGFRAGTCFPYRLGSVWEIPFQLMDSALRYQCVNLVERKAIAGQILDEVRSCGGVLVLNWHTQVMNPDVFPDEIEILELLVQKAKKDNAWMARPCDIVEWWNQRRGSAQHSILNCLVC